MCGVTLQCRTVLAPVPKCGLSVWGQARNWLPGPPRLVPVSIFYPKLPGGPSWWRLCPLCPVTFPCLTGNHTTQGKECLGAEKQEGSTEGHCPQGPSPCSLSKETVPALTQRPLPSLSRLRVCVCSGTTEAPESTESHFSTHRTCLKFEELEELPCIFLGLKSVFGFECLTPGKGSRRASSRSFRFRKGWAGREQEPHLPVRLFPLVLC